ncbi:hypothetical protein ACQPZG_08920 [Streptomyces sp. CA-294286]|uniref:hypothetical protein n=1 Tax=Streptomyces sp. CA-294286 TaxID=3240070 RepID=UPI003D8A2C38
MAGSTPEPGLEQWAEEGRTAIADLADMIGVPAHIYNADPTTLVPALQNYVSRLPFGDFKESDWVTVHSDLIAYVADYLIRKHGACWATARDTGVPKGYRYVVEANGCDGEIHRVDPADVVMKEFGKLPIEITRMLASAELTLRLTSVVEESG